jgi:hypothetical protein
MYVHVRFHYLVCYVTLRHQIRKPVMMHTYPTNSEIKEINLITVLKEYFTDNTFELCITIVVIHFCSYYQTPKYEARTTS